MVLTIDVGRVFGTLGQSLVAAVTTAVCVLLMWAGFQVFDGYGITFAVAFHCMLVLLVMAFLAFVIYTTWKQTYQTAKGLPID